jgi:GTPase
MRFIDEALIDIEAGNGGPGSVSFRREKYIARGGPDGGDGGRGGNVLFVTTDRLNTLQEFRYKRHFKAESGHHGSGANKTGRSGDDLIIYLPVGTSIKDDETGELLADLTEKDQEWVAAKGGRGGKGNAHFATSTHQAPRYAQPGEEGTGLRIKLELKLLADIGIIGFPNAGKSTLISKLSAARPKIADYAFTTLTPNLGVVSTQDHNTFVVADIPGLIEGAHRGAGLGHQFLKHVERTDLFLHLLDGARFLDSVTRPEFSEEGIENEEETAIEDAVSSLTESYQAVRKELELFNPQLLKKRELVVLNKKDLFASQPQMLEVATKKIRAVIQETRGDVADNEPVWISSATGESIESIKYRLYDLLQEARRGYAQ